MFCFSVIMVVIALCSLFHPQDMDHPPGKHRFDELTWCAHRFPQNEKVVHETCSMNMFAT